MGRRRTCRDGSDSRNDGRKELIIMQELYRYDAVAFHQLQSCMLQQVVSTVLLLGHFQQEVWRKGDNPRRRYRWMVREGLGDIHVLYEPCSPMKRGSGPFAVPNDDDRGDTCVEDLVYTWVIIIISPQVIIGRGRRRTASQE
jgi:hypothetical protein